MAFLVLQARPERDAADGEFAAILGKAGLAASEVQRYSLEDAALRGVDVAGFDGVIVGGGPGCVSDAEKPADQAAMEDGLRAVLPAITEGDVPYMGCCYGLGVLADHLGAEVSKARYSEPIGAVTCRKVADDPLLAGVPAAFDAFVGHKEAVQALPEGAVHLLAGEACPFQMIRYKSNVYATQFHPECDGPVLAARIQVYRHHGYFPPEAADALAAQALAADVTVPPLLLHAFVNRYRGRV